jgi:hypothetical protein
MTTSGRPPRERRLLVNLSVLAGSAVMLAVSWSGIVSADQDSGRAALAAPAAASTAPIPLPPAVTMTVPSTEPASTAGLVPAPSPAPRRVVVTRRSRAS